MQRWINFGFLKVDEWFSVGDNTGVTMMNRDFCGVLNVAGTSTIVDDLAAQVEEIVLERDAVYGGFEAVSDLSEALTTALDATDRFDRLPPFQRLAMRMICHKMARLITGDSYHMDSWDDIAGYALVTKKAMLLRASDGESEA